MDGFIAQHRSVRRPWYLRWLSTVLVVAVIGVSFVSSAPFGDMSAGVAVAFAVALVVLVGFAVGVGLLVRRVFDASRWLYRLRARQLMRANPMLSRPMQATVAEAGAYLSSLAEGSATSWSWSQFPLHVETDRSFVLLASERRGAAVLVLPKRGLDGAHPARLRALLSAHTSRRA